MLAMLLSVAAVSPAAAHGAAQAIFWFDSHPGFPPRELWRPEDTAMALAHEMACTQMRSRAGDRAHFDKLRKLGFGGVGLPGFDGPYDALPGEDIFEYDGNPDHTHDAAAGPFDPDSDAASNLDRVHQTRNARYYVSWTREAGLDPYLLLQFWGRGHAADEFNWGDQQWARITDYVQRVARFARRHRCTGLIFDFEPYSLNNQQWSLTRCMAQQQLDRQGALQRMQQRGAEFAKAIAAQWPECVLQVYGIGNAPGISAQDAVDVWRYFFAGLCAAGLINGVHHNDAATYYWSEPSSLGNLYVQAREMLQSVGPLLQDPKYLERCTVSLGTAFMNRWFTWDAMYWRPISVYRAEEVRRITLALRQLCPRYFWVCGDWAHDWIEASVSDEFGDPAGGVWGVGMPFTSLAERNATLTAAFAQVMAIPDGQVAGRFEEMVAGLHETERRLAAERSPKLLDKRVAILYHDYIEPWTHPNDLHRQQRVWDIRLFRDPSCEEVVAALPELDLVVSAFSAPRAAPDMAAYGAQWRQFVERGGVLVIADAARNPQYAPWLEAIAPELELPADLAPCAKLRPLRMLESELMAGPNRVSLAAWDQAWNSVPPGWTVAAETHDGLPAVVYRRYGKGLVAATMCSEQVGFTWRLLENLILMVAR